MDDESLEEWSARSRRDPDERVRPPWTLRLASGLLIATGGLSAALVAPAVFRRGDPLDERSTAIPLLIGALVLIALGAWLGGGSKRAHTAAILTSLVAFIGLIANYAEDGTQSAIAWIINGSLAVAPAILLLTPNALRWRRDRAT